MAEQISHKKSLRVSRLSKDRRLLLKEYYQLDEPQSAEVEAAPPMNGEAAEETGAGESNKSDMGDKPIDQCKFADLMRLHNSLLKKETETNNSIKNTIYENYYDLIKVNDLLKEMSQSNEPLLDRLKDLTGLLQED